VSRSFFASFKSVWLGRNLRPSGIFFANFVLLFAIYLLRWWRIDPYFNVYDSPSYFNFTLWENHRGILVTLPYLLIQDYKLIALFQNLVGALAWAFVGSVLSSRFKSATVGISFQLSILTLACTSPIYEHNNVLMAESLSISSAVVFFALFLHWEYRRTEKALIYAIIGLIWMALTKQSYALVAPVFFSLLFCTYARCYGLKNKRVLLLSPVGIIWPLLMAFSTHNVSNYNFIALIYYRFSKDKVWLDWWKELQFPSEVLTFPEFSNVLSDPRVVDWLRDNSNLELVKFYLEFPLILLVGVFFLPLFSSYFNWGDTGLGVIFGGTRLTEQLNLENQNYLFGFWPRDYFYTTQNLLFSAFVLSVTLALYFVMRVRGIRVGTYLSLTLAFMIYALMQVTFLLGPLDLPRIFIGIAAVLRILAIYYFWVAISKLLTSK
jgi:hypothetical protein